MSLQHTLAFEDLQTVLRISRARQASLNSLVDASGNILAKVDGSGAIIPLNIDPTTYYYVNDFVDVQVAGNYNQAGNVVVAGANSVSAPLSIPSTVGVLYVNTSSATAGGYCCMPFSVCYVKSAVITYQWRYLFYLPAASISTNRYTAYVGGFWATGAATQAGFGVAGGPFLKYSDNVNSGNWVMGSSTNAGTLTTVNSSTAALPGAWNSAVITLANGVYTFTVNGVVLGTVADTNLTATSPTVNQNAGAGGIAILPDGTNYTTQRTMMLDRLDFYVTGLTR